jgi:predicted metallo-beta-lactamase superfamily hydrolase
MNEFVRNGRELGVDVTKTNEYKNAEMTYSALEEYRKEIMKLADEAELKAKQLS